ncbi:hypothetical protein FRC10_002289 [Ceratobasidium sp. 414]|nr:hypothetical protein FRC10_002289 [Ceratobasidium sp. 414]
MMIPGPNAGAAGANTVPGVWERPQSTFQSYFAAVQSKLVEREGKKKGEEEVGPRNGAETSSTQADSNAMDVDIKEEPVTSASGSHSNTPGPELSQGSRIASPEHSNPLQALHSVQASPASGLGIPLPAPPGLLHSNAQQTHTPVPQSHPLPQVHPLPLPPRPRSPPRAPRSPPRGPRATRGLPEKPKAMSIGGQDFSRERDRDRDSVERGARDRNAGTGGVQPPEGERKVHALPTNPARRPRVPVVRATKREVLFPDLEKEPWINGGFARTLRGDLGRAWAESTNGTAGGATFGPLFASRRAKLRPPVLSHLVLAKLTRPYITPLSLVHLSQGDLHYRRLRGFYCRG